MKIKTSCLGIALLALLLLSKVGWCGDPSPTFHNDNQRTGRTNNIGPNEAILLRTFPTRGSLQASPVTGPDGTSFLASTDSCLYTLSPEGGLKWTFLAKSALYSTPALGLDGTLHFADLSGWLYALSPDGRVKWTYELTDGSERRVIAAPVVGQDGRSYWASWNNHVYALSAGGALIWTTTVGGLISSPLALDREENLYMASLDKANPTHMRFGNFRPMAGCFGSMRTISGSIEIGSWLLQP